MAKKGRYTIPVDADTSPAEKKIKKTFKDKTVRIKPIRKTLASL